MYIYHEGRRIRTEWTLSSSITPTIPSKHPSLRVDVNVKDDEEGATASVLDIQGDHNACVRLGMNAAIEFYQNIVLDSTALMLAVTNHHILSTDPQTATGDYVNKQDYHVCTSTMREGESGQNEHYRALLHPQYHPNIHRYELMSTSMMMKRVQLPLYWTSKAIIMRVSD